MLSALKKILTSWTTRKPTDETPLFSGSAYFSSRVPKYFSEKWVESGGEISLGTTLDARARYFFATDPSDPWVTKLFAKSVIVIHAGWIVHCVDEAFRVPISEYILDDNFVPGPPYKLVDHFPPAIYVPLSEPREPTGTEFAASRPTSVETCDTPSTPTSMPRKRKREQAYFDSPTGSLVFSGFDKDGMPRRPRKQRKLRFDPSFSPDGGRSRRETVVALDWLRDHYDDDKFSEERVPDRGPGTPRGYTTTMWPLETPNKLFTNASTRHLSVGEDLLDRVLAPSPAIFIRKQEKTSPVRTIDFTNLPPAGPRRFPEAETTAKSGATGMTLSIVKPTEHKTPKRISFANHARVCVYTISPCRLDTREDEDVGPTLQALGEGLDSEDGQQEIGDARSASSDEVKGSDDATAEEVRDKVFRTDPDPRISNDSAWLPYENRPQGDILTFEDVQTMRSHLLELAAKNNVDNGHLATLFELGKTYRGMAFDHVW